MASAVTLGPTCSVLNVPKSTACLTGRLLRASVRCQGLIQTSPGFPGGLLWQPLGCARAALNARKGRASLTGPIPRENASSFACRAPEARKSNASCQPDRTDFARQRAHSGVTRALQGLLAVTARFTCGDLDARKGDANPTGPTPRGSANWVCFQ